MTVPTFLSARDAILYFAGNRDGLVQKWIAGDKEWICAGGQDLDGPEYIEAFKNLRASGLLRHSTGHDFLLNERGEEAAKAVLERYAQVA